MAGPDILSILIREGMVVRIYGIPWDLTQVEAQKISRVILAHSPPFLPEGAAKPVYPQGIRDNP